MKAIFKHTGITPSGKVVIGHYFYDSIKDKHFILQQLLTGEIVECLVDPESVKEEL
jgi:tryptophanyl-tRNA synthetase